MESAMVISKNSAIADAPDATAPFSASISRTPSAIFEKPQPAATRRACVRASSPRGRIARKEDGAPKDEYQTRTGKSTVLRQPGPSVGRRQHQRNLAELQTVGADSAPGV
jgi:hypothetical protein